MLFLFFFVHIKTMQTSPLYVSEGALASTMIQTRLSRPPHGAAHTSSEHFAECCSCRAPQWQLIGRDGGQPAGRDARRGCILPNQFVCTNPLIWPFWGENGGICYSLFLSDLTVQPVKSKFNSSFPKDTRNIEKTEIHQMA